jgi:hypothetical protein
MRLAGAIRPVLWIGAAFNVVVALSMLFPPAFGLASPPAGARFNAWILAWFVVLFGAAYGWMAMQAVIPRPLVALAAIGKADVFVIALACLLRGDIGPPLFAVAIVDLLFALAFLAWWRGAPMG